MSVAPRKVAPSKVGSLRLTTMLTLVGAIAGFLIVSAYTTTLHRIEGNREATIDRAMRDVLPGIARYEKLQLAEPGKVYAGYGSDGALVGFGVVSIEPGFQDPIEILYGYDPRTKSVLGLSILVSKETPGLGDRIQSAGWLAQFRQRVAPLIGVKRGSASGPSTVDLITGATISSRAVVGAVNRSAAKWDPLLRARLAGGEQ
jgi:H+/Na+-translocating ferredoxin:NAD+ oxidoreductase subunit G